jgi:hypothetical protein
MEPSFRSAAVLLGHLRPLLSFNNMEAKSAPLADANLRQMTGVEARRAVTK